MTVLQTEFAVFVLLRHSNESLGDKGDSYVLLPLESPFIPEHVLSNFRFLDVDYYMMMTNDTVTESDDVMQNKNSRPFQ